MNLSPLPTLVRIGLVVAVKQLPPTHMSGMVDRGTNNNYNKKLYTPGNLQIQSPGPEITMQVG